jgi:hypothetical protein
VEYSRDPDDLHGDTIVCQITIACRRNGTMSVSGHINDEAYAMAMLDTAKQSLKSHHDKIRMGQRGGMIIPAHDTALVGTPEERKLYEAREDIARRRAG